MKDSDARDEELRELITEIRSARSEPKKLAFLLEVYENDFGLEAEKRVLEIIAENTEKAWAMIAEKREKNDIQGILDTLWGSFEKAGGEFTVERTEDSAQIHCTKCPMADTYLKIGKPEYGLIFHCSTDPHIVAGFNPEMEFRITKRLMSEDECCDHYYQL
ncbi:MAG: L-2-amino-thiazoline-4-carboxylic acid hydrolase [Promethearchaeota archaeon]